MRFCGAACALILFGCFGPCCFGSAQQKTPTAHSSPESATIPFTLDHNRVIIDVDLRLSDDSTQRVRAWVDNGNPDLYISRRLAKKFTCNGRICSSEPPLEMAIGGMSIPLGGPIPAAGVLGAGIKEAKIILPADGAESMMAPGLPAEINIPSTVLRHYDVLIDFPGHKFSIGAPGTIQFRGPSAKVQVNPENGLIQISSQIEKRKYSLAFDLGATVSFLSDELFEKLQTAHPDWPRLTAAVGPANMWGLDDETKWKLMRIDRVQIGPLFLTDVAVAEMPTTYVDFLEKPSAPASAGVLGADLLLNYRVGFDYAHSMVYFDIGRLFNFPEFDVVGLILRPESDGRFTILGIADLDAKPSVPQGADGVQSGDQLIAVDDIPVRSATMGQVWAMLGGTPGQERRLTIERGGKRFAVAAQVQHFLGEVAGDSESKKKKK